MSKRKPNNGKQAKHIQKRIERNQFDGVSTKVYKNPHRYNRKLRPFGNKPK